MTSKSVIVLSQQKIQNRTYHLNQLIICVFVDTYPVYFGFIQHVNLFFFL